MKSHLVIFISSTLIFLAGCGSQDLDRPLAEKLLKENETILAFQNNIPLHENADSIGQRLRWWEKLEDGFSTQALENGLNKDFTRLELGRMIQAGVVAPAPIDIEVTGIIKSNSEVTAIAEFNWRYRDLNPRIAYIAIEGGVGKAMFQRYDDGWRISNSLDLKHNRTPYVLSASQARELENEVVRIEAQEKIAKVKEAQARSERIANAAQLIVGTWDSRSRMGLARLRYKDNGSYEILSKRGNSYVVVTNGRWSIENNRLEMQVIETSEDRWDGKMSPSNSAPFTVTILDISPNAYAVEQPVVYTGGASGNEVWNAHRVE